MQQPRAAPVVSTAADAAIAINSIAFMNILCGRKNTADVRTFMQPIPASIGKDNNSHLQQIQEVRQQAVSVENEAADMSSRTVINAFFREEEQENCPAGTISISPEHNAIRSINAITNTKNRSPATATHETVAEYIGKLWFLPKEKGTIKFRETIRIISVGLDGETSTVECHTQYYNGNKWVDCSKVLCHFSSLLKGHGEDSVGPSNDAFSLQQKVRMTLDCQLLVWLPLPSIASKAVRKKISSVFEEIVIDFFDELTVAA